MTWGELRVGDALAWPSNVVPGDDTLWLLTAHGDHERLSSGDLRVLASTEVSLLTGRVWTGARDAAEPLMPGLRVIRGGEELT